MKSISSYGFVNGRRLIWLMGMQSIFSCACRMILIHIRMDNRFLFKSVEFILEICKWTTSKCCEKTSLLKISLLFEYKFTQEITIIVSSRMSYLSRISYRKLTRRNFLKNSFGHEILKTLSVE